MIISSEKFDLAGEWRFYRGTIRDDHQMRFTLKTFKDRDAAELYTLALMMRYRSILQ